MDTLPDPAVLADEVLDFVRRTVSPPDAAPLDCPNWQEAAHHAARFASSFHPEALYVSVSDTAFAVTPELALVGADRVAVLVKSEQPLHVHRPLHTQIHVVNFSDANSSYEQIRVVLALAIAPYFDHVVHPDAAALSVAATRRKLGELSLLLAHLQQRIHVPDLLLAAPQHVREVLQGTDDEVDTSLLNDLTKTVNTWIRQIQAITSLLCTPSDSGSIADEVLFWKLMETVLAALREQVARDEVKRAIDILNAAKRFQVTLAFQNNLGIAEKLDETAAYNALLKELPIADLAYAKDSDLPKLAATVTTVFSHLKRWKSLTTFPLGQMISLVELLLAELVLHLTALLSEMHLMTFPYATLAAMYNDSILPLISLMESNAKFMVNVIREIMRKRQEKFMIVKIDQSLLSTLRDRLAELLSLRSKHEDLLLAVARVESDKHADIEVAFNNYIVATSPFDFSNKGNSIWLANQQAYLQDYAKVQHSISAHINRRFAGCHDFNDYYNILRKFQGTSNASTLITSSIDDKNKLVLLNLAYNDIQLLFKVSHLVHQKFDSGNPEHVVDILMWNASLQDKLHFYTETLTGCLGETWSRYSIGTKIELETTAFIANMKTDKIFRSWVDNAQKTLSKSKNGESVLCLAASDDGTQQIVVNYDDKHASFVSQAKCLSALNYDIPVTLRVQLNNSKAAHPLALSLCEHIEVLEAILQHLSSTDFGSKFGFMVTSQLDRVRDTLQSCLSVTWSLIRHELSTLKSAESKTDLTTNNLARIGDLQEAISKLHYRFNLIQRTCNVLQNTYYKQLKWCKCASEDIASVIDQIQIELLALSRADYNDLDHFLILVNEEIAQILSEKIAAELRALSDHLSGIHRDGVVPDLATLTHKVLYESDVFVFSPPLGASKLHWINQIDSLIAIFQTQTEISFSGEKRSISPTGSHFADAFSRVMVVIEDQSRQAYEYCKGWSLLQNLFADNENNFPNSADGSETWLQFVSDVLELKRITTNSEGSYRLGQYLEISYSKIASQVSKQYKALRAQVFEMFTEHVRTKTLLELSELSSAETFLSDDVDINLDPYMLLKYVEEVYALDSRTSGWNATLEYLTKCQLLLQKQLVDLSSNWIYVEQLDSNLANVASLLAQRKARIKDNSEFLKLKLSSEWDKCQLAKKNFMTKWVDQKPVSSHIEPLQALSTLATTQAQLNELNGRTESLRRIATSLTLPPLTDKTLDDIQEDITDIKFVWETIQKFWDSLEGLKSQIWSEVDPRSLKRDLESMMSECSDSPSLVRQYSAFESLVNTIRNILLNYSILSDLKSPAMKERHWAELFKLVGLKIHPQASITVRDILKIDFQAYHTVLQNMIQQANGELVIEEGLKAIKDEWSTTVFETFNFEGKCRLVRNWTALFEQCNSNLSSLASMRNSVFHNIFEKDRADLEIKLNDLLNLFNVWIEVQRQWVYLEGIFGGNNEVKSSLPLESSRFNNISFEFTSLLKKVNTYSLVFEILSINGIQKAMERILDSMTKTRKGLFDYLERQREAFPRFYFVGNEDLLELLGSGTKVEQINRHLKQMFVGISSVVYNPESSSISAVVSREGEIFKLDNAISLIKNREATLWLKELEVEIRLSMSNKIAIAVNEVKTLFSSDVQSSEFLSTLNTKIAEIPNQVLLVAFQVEFSRAAGALLQNSSLSTLVDFYAHLSRQLTQLATSSDDAVHLKKLRALIIETIHCREILLKLLKSDGATKAAIWNAQQVFRFDPSVNDPLNRVTITQGGYYFFYGFEYHGVVERLALTPLVDKCFYAMTQALAHKLGGSPFGPAGTGKTECIKALGHNLGRMVLVFCCDETFDYQSMGRILLGICKVGCWGCFDEFNRLDPNILSALSSQIEHIETGLQENAQVEVSGKLLNVHDETGIFVTMNPGYVGRNELPENLKRLFIAFSMTYPDKEKIAEVLMTSYGFIYSEELSKLLVPFFTELEETSSSQSHYDFGLRALKSILNHSGAARKALQITTSEGISLAEKQLLVQSLHSAIMPKLIFADETVLENLIAKYFPSIVPHEVVASSFSLELTQYGKDNGLIVNEEFIKKARQLAEIQQSHHGFMLVGEAGSGKTTVMKLVLHALTRSEGDEKPEVYVIDSKVISKELLYGTLDPITRDWTDGLLTRIIRTILTDLRGEFEKRTWIVFDGDIDPEWAENLNSVLDDNKLLTLPNGERLQLPKNVRIVFEVDSLKYTTLATISRCGMVWFDRSNVQTQDLWVNYLHRFRSLQFRDLNAVDDVFAKEEIKRTHNILADTLDMLLSVNELKKIETFTGELHHIMDFEHHRAITAFFTHFSSICLDLVDFRLRYPGTSYDPEPFVLRAIILALMWAFSGDCSFEDRSKLQTFILGMDAFSKIQIPNSVMQYKISVPDFEWESWSSKVEVVDLEPHQVLESSTIIPTVDTVIHESLILGVIHKHSPLLLCGPPGSGKTMTLLNSLRRSPNLDLVSLNFSKDTTPESVLATMEQHCQYKRSNSGLILSPRVNGKWVVVFCDEINLPTNDKYGTQRVMSFLRQMVEHGGFWRPKDLKWVQLQNIQFVGACNDPKDPGRNKLPERFLRHVTLLLVDHPSDTAMKQIYHTFNLSVLKCAPNLRSYADVLTSSMLQVYIQTKGHLSVAKRSHYIYSPRELTRWTRGILETLMSVSYSDLEQLVRLWFHEGFRLFYDRLVEDDEKSWCKKLFWDVAELHYQHVNLDKCLKEPVLFSTWLTSRYEPVHEEELIPFVRERLRVFSEEEIDVDLVLYKDLLDHALRIDRVLRQHQGHMILVGPNTSGKSTLTKFVGWMNGLKVVQLRVHSGYTILDFEAAMRDLLLCCAKGEKICFLIDESSILETSFIERMNSLLANAEVPGLFTGDDLDTLYKLCLSESAAQGLLLDSDDELYSWFTNQVSENLHVVFTMSDLESGTKPQVNSSPALFNRCVLSWMGDWTNSSLLEIAESVLSSVPLDLAPRNYEGLRETFLQKPLSNLRDAAIDALIYIHRSHPSEAPPGKFLEFVKLSKDLFFKNQDELERNQRQTNVGLDKLRETVLEVSQMKKKLSEKQVMLRIKDEEAKKMLNKMISGQNEAERKKEFSVATQIELRKQEQEISGRRSVVLKDLEEAEPAVLEAQRGVQNIKKQHLTEMRSMSNPPAAIKMAMESVCVLLGYQANSWRDVQLIIRKDDFIASIVNYDNESRLTAEMREYMEEVYLSRPDYNYETIHRASKACGPLLQWVIAQIRYSSILQKVGPLREEVAGLEQSANKSRAQLIAIAEMIQELEDSIEAYKDGYSELIRDAERVKVEMQSIETKVARSLRLIENLTKERKRWQASILAFNLANERLIGNSILGAAFATYCGELNQNDRLRAVSRWRHKLRDTCIAFDESLNLTSLLATSEEMAHWESNGLSNDSLFVENFAIKTWSEVPFLVDPQGELLPVLAATLLPRKLVITSFLADSFVKAVEDALRFGGLIVIQNAESYNPILDSVIRREVTQNGGRKAVRLGAKMVSVLNGFSLILYTRVSGEMPLFLRSRSTELNFSITESNLENQVLDLSLQFSNPALFSKRHELILLQSGYHIHLLELKSKLLTTLNEAEGTILDSDAIIESLEALETEATQIDCKISEAEEVMTGVEDTRYKFSDVASHLKSIFVLLVGLSKSTKFYNFTIATFIDIFEELLEAFVEKDSINETLTTQLYKRIFNEVYPALRQHDKLPFALSLVASFYKLEIGLQVQQALVTLLKNYAEEQELENWVTSIFDVCLVEREEGNIRERWQAIVAKNEGNDSFKVISNFLDVLVGQGTGSMLDAYSEFAGAVLGKATLAFEVGDIFTGKRPLLITMSEEYDPTFKIEEAARQQKQKLAVISLGTAEGVANANKHLDNAVKDGGWVLLQNAHMSASWLSQLEVKLYSIGSGHDSFRLFLTCSLHSEEVPEGLISMCKIVTIEEQPEWKSLLSTTFKLLALVQMNALQSRIMFLLSWCHTTMQERMKYVPHTFTKHYDISDLDVISAGKTIRKFVDGLRTVPWQDIAYLVGEIVYGGKIANSEDKEYCEELARGLFSEETYDKSYSLVNNAVAKKAGIVVAMPQDTTPEGVLKWIEQLPDKAPLSWLGLENDFCSTLEEQEARAAARRAVTMMQK